MRAVGSFRNVPFIIRSDDLDFGRRAQVHEYPLRDKPYVEDLGRKARRFSIDVFVVAPSRMDPTQQGNDYREARDDLIRAIEKPGAGPLEHPYYGTLKVHIIRARVRESSRNGGMAQVTLTCVEAGEFPFTADYPDTSELVKTRKRQVEDAAVEAFEEEYSLLDQAEDFVEAIQEEIGNILKVVDDVISFVGEIEALISGVTSAVADLIRAPFNLGVALIGSFNRILTVIEEPFRALRLYESLFSAGSDSPAIPTTTANRQRQADNVAALHRLVRHAALAGAAETAASMTFDTAADALAVRDRLLDELDAQMEIVESDAVYQALADLRAALAEDMRIRAARLPELADYTPGTTLPALALAHQIHGDAKRADEIVTRNRIRHPGFVPGGQSLEVIDG